MELRRNWHKLGGKRSSGSGMVEEPKKKDTWERNRGTECQDLHDIVKGKWKVGSKWLAWIFWENGKLLLTWKFRGRAVLEMMWMNLVLEVKGKTRLRGALLKQERSISWITVFLIILLNS